MQGGARKRDIVPILHSFAAMNPPGMKVLIRREMMMMMMMVMVS